MLTIVKKRRKPTYSEIRRLAQLQVTTREAAGWFGYGEAAFLRLLRKDAEALRIWETGQQEGKISLRRRQIRLSGSNAQMAIFLGKQMLGQSDVTVHEHSGRDGGPITQQIDLKQLDHDERQKLRRLIERARRG